MATAVPAVAPGPRLTKFHQVLQLALDRTLGALSLEEFLKCFPQEIVTSHNALLVSLHETILLSVETNVTKEFEVILNEKNISEKLNKLDDLIIQQPYFGNGQRIPAPALITPMDEIRRESHDLKLKEKENLTKLLKQLETDNTELKQKLQAHQSRKEQLTGDIAKLQPELEKALETSKSWDGDQVKALLASLPKST